MEPSGFGINLFHGDGQNRNFHASVAKKTTGNEIQKGEDTFCDATALALAALRTRHNYFHGAVDSRGRVPRHTPNCKNVLAARPRTNSNASLENLAPAKIASGEIGPTDCSRSVFKPRFFSTFCPGGVAALTQNGPPATFRQHSSGTGFSRGELAHRGALLGRTRGCHLMIAPFACTHSFYKGQTTARSTWLFRRLHLMIAPLLVLTGFTKEKLCAIK